MPPWNSHLHHPTTARLFFYSQSSSHCTTKLYCLSGSLFAQVVLVMFFHLLYKFLFFFFFANKNVSKRNLVSIVSWTLAAGVHIFIAKMNLSMSYRIRPHMSIKLGTKFDAFQKLGGTQLTWTSLMSCHFRLHISLKCSTKFDAFSELFDTLLTCSLVLSYHARCSVSIYIFFTLAPPLPTASYEACKEF